MRVNAAVCTRLCECRRTVCTQVTVCVCVCVCVYVVSQRLGTSLQSEPSLARDRAEVLSWGTEGPGGGDLRR